jgi:hypothetical protein
MILKDPNLIESCVKDLKDEQTSPKRQVELCRFLKGSVTLTSPRHIFIRVFHLRATFAAARQGRIPQDAAKQWNSACDRDLARL